MPNADQNPGIDPKYLSMPIIADHWSPMISIDRHWDQCCNFDRHWSALGNDPGSADIWREYICKCRVALLYKQINMTSYLLFPSCISSQGYKIGSVCLCVRLSALSRLNRLLSCPILNSVSHHVTCLLWAEYQQRGGASTLRCFHYSVWYNTLVSFYW